MRTVALVVDTTALYNNYDVAGREWAELAELVRAGAIQVAVPRVVVRETARHYRREASRVDQLVISTLADTLKQLGRVAAVPTLNVKALRDELRERRDGYEEQLESRLISLGAQIPDVPSMRTEVLFEWAIAERQPFKSTGEGFRDALVWGTVLEVARGLVPDDLVILVSANRKDFCDKDGLLAPALTADLGSLPNAPSVQVVAALADAFPLFEVEAAEARSTRDAMRELEGDDYEGATDPEDVIYGPVLQACGGLTGQLLSEAGGDRVQLETLTGRTVTFQLTLPANLRDASVYEVEPVPETLAWSEYDRYGDRSLGHAIVQSYLTIDGTIPVSEVEAVSNEWNLEHLDDSFDDEDLDNDGYGEGRAWIAMSFTVEMRFSASVVASAYSVEGLELEAVSAAVR